MAEDLIDDFDIDDIEHDSVIEADEDRSGAHALPRLSAPAASETLPDGQRLEQRRFTGGDTLDEPVLDTIMRDVRSFGRLLLQTVGWNQKEVAARREWDLWGPLIFCLGISLVLALQAQHNQKSHAFAMVFSLLWTGQALITGNVKLLGGTISYLHALSITGYSLFPLLLGSIFSYIVHNKFVRLGLNVVLVYWAIWSARRGLGFAGVVDKRIALAAYPLGLFYTCLGWMCVVA